MQKKILVVFTIITGMLFLFTNDAVYAQDTWDINIPSGAGNDMAPFHWQSDKDADTSGNIEIVVDDSVHWKNGDTTFHTVTSGTPQTGPNGKFDSGSFGPGKTFLYQFTEIGQYPYYCTLHPWMAGVVTVISGLNILSNVGIDVGDGSTTFDVEYDFNRIINTVSVNEETKSITFEFIGNTNTDDNTLILILPTDLIDGISTVSVDGISTSEFELIHDNDATLLVVNSLLPESKSLTVSGATIVPEFGLLVMVVMIIAITSVIVVTKKSLTLKL